MGIVDKSESIVSIGNLGQKTKRGGNGHNFINDRSPVGSEASRKQNKGAPISGGSRKTQRMISGGAITSHSSGEKTSQKNNQL